MKKLGLSLCAVWFAACIVLGLAGTASSRPQYKKAFDTKYLKPNSADASEKELAAAIATVRCNACHDHADPKNQETYKQRNRYGKELAKILHPKETNKKTIEDALDSVAAAKVDPSDPNSPTFGDLLHQGKLPGGQ